MRIEYRGPEGHQPSSEELGAETVLELPTRNVMSLVNAGIFICPDLAYGLLRRGLAQVACGRDLPIDLCTPIQGDGPPADAGPQVSPGHEIAIACNEDSPGSVAFVTETR